MERLTLSLLTIGLLCAHGLAGSVSRSAAYTGYSSYGRQSPPAVAANGRPGRSSYYGGAGDGAKPIDQMKANTTPDKKPGGSGMSAWGIIAIIVCMCLSLMGVYYFTIFYPILCKKEQPKPKLSVNSIP